MNKIQSFLYMIGGILLLCGAAMPLFDFLQEYAHIIYSIGAVLFSAMQFSQSNESKDYIVRRLRRQQMIGLVFLLLAAVMMWMSKYQISPFRADEWKLALTIGAIIQVYTAFRIPAAINKSEKK